MPDGWPSDQLLAARHEGARPAQKALAGPPAHARKRVRGLIEQKPINAP